MGRLEAAAAEGYVDVLADGFAFRLRLATDRDAAVLAAARAAAAAAGLPPPEQSPAADLALRAWHQGAVSGVAGVIPAFGAAVRLAKRWVGAHLLSPHLAEEAVELMVAAAFTAREAGQPAGLCCIGLGGPGLLATGA